MEVWLALHHLLNIKSAHGRLNQSVIPSVPQKTQWPDRSIGVTPVTCRDICKDNFIGALPVGKGMDVVCIGPVPVCRGLTPVVLGSSQQTAVYMQVVGTSPSRQDSRLGFTGHIQQSQSNTGDHLE